jgi:pimeloyl-ACP methyl ester carboxylesterase
MKLYLKESGSKNAPTIVFLHGLGVSSWMWDEQIEVLQKDYHCLAIDLPCNGESTATAWLSFADTAAQVAEVIRQHSLTGKAHIVGLSLGGYTALFLLQKHPEVIESMIVSGVTVKPFSQQWLWRGLVKLMPFIMQRNMVINLSSKMMQLPPEAAELYKRDVKRLSADIFKRVYAEVLNLSLPSELATRPHRLLAVAGDKEVKAVKNDLAEFSKHLPNTQTSIVPNAHHAWNGEHPQLFTDMIRAWVENQPLPEELAVHKTLAVATR